LKMEKRQKIKQEPSKVSKRKKVLQMAKEIDAVRKPDFDISDQK